MKSVGLGRILWHGAGDEYHWQRRPPSSSSSKTWSTFKNDNLSHYILFYGAPFNQPPPVLFAVVVMAHCCHDSDQRNDLHERCYAPITQFRRGRKLEINTSSSNLFPSVITVAFFINSLPILLKKRINF